MLVRKQSNDGYECNNSCNSFTVCGSVNFLIQHGNQYVLPWAVGNISSTKASYATFRYEPKGPHIL